MRKIKNDLEMDFMLHKWFHQNHMVLNPGKYPYIAIGMMTLLTK